MKRHFLGGLFLTAVVATSFSQDKIKYETVYFEDNAVETQSAKVALSNVVCEKDFIKAKVKVVNYTDKALVLKPEECTYSTPVGDIPSKDKWLVVAPRQTEAKTIDVKGDNVKTTETTFKVNGLYICNTVEIITALDMPLPPEKFLTIGNFKLELDTWDRDGKEILIRYRIRYVGDKVGMFNPGKVMLKSPDGSEYKNMKDKDKVLAFKKNEDFLVGFMYLSDSKKDNILMWKEAFTEGTPDKLEPISVTVKMDLPQTKDKN